MNTTEESTRLSYRDSDSVSRTLGGCRMTIDKAGRFWLWSEQLEQNLSYRAKSREDAFLAAIDSLLFIVKLREERIASLQRIADLAQQFAEAVNPPQDNDD